MNSFFQLRAIKAYEALERDIWNYATMRQTIIEQLKTQLIENTAVPIQNVEAEAERLLQEYIQQANWLLDSRDQDLHVPLIKRQGHVAKRILKTKLPKNPIPGPRVTTALKQGKLPSRTNSATESNSAFHQPKKRPKAKYEPAKARNYPRPWILVPKSSTKTFVPSASGSVEKVLPLKLSALTKSNTSSTQVIPPASAQSNDNISACSSVSSTNCVSITTSECFNEQFNVRRKSGYYQKHVDVKFNTAVKDSNSLEGSENQSTSKHSRRIVSPWIDPKSLLPRKRRNAHYEEEDAEIIEMRINQELSKTEVERYPDLEPEQEDETPQNPFGSVYRAMVFYNEFEQFLDNYLDNRIVESPASSETEVVPAEAETPSLVHPCVPTVPVLWEGGFYSQVYSVLESGGVHIEEVLSADEGPTSNDATELVAAGPGPEIVRQKKRLAVEEKVSVERVRKLSPSGTNQVVFEKCTHKARDTINNLLNNNRGRRARTVLPKSYLQATGRGTGTGAPLRSSGSLAVMPHQQSAANPNSKLSRIFSLSRKPAESKLKAVMKGPTQVAVHVPSEEERGRMGYNYSEDYGKLKRAFGLHPKVDRLLKEAKKALKDQGKKPSKDAVKNGKKGSKDSGTAKDSTKEGKKPAKGSKNAVLPLESEAGHSKPSRQPKAIKAVQKSEPEPPNISLAEELGRYTDEEGGHVSRPRTRNSRGSAKESKSSINDSVRIKLQRLAITEPVVKYDILEGKFTGETSKAPLVLATYGKKQKSSGGARSTDSSTSQGSPPRPKAVETQIDENSTVVNVNITGIRFHGISKSLYTPLRNS